MFSVFRVTNGLRKLQFRIESVMLYPVLEALIFLAFFLCAFFCVILSGSKNQFDVVSPIDGCLFSIAGAFEE